jgi:hypothetical protein
MVEKDSIVRRNSTICQGYFFCISCRIRPLSCCVASFTRLRWRRSECCARSVVRGAAVNIQTVRSFGDSRSSEDVSHLQCLGAFARGRYLSEISAYKIWKFVRVFRGQMPNAIRCSAANLNLRPKESAISKYRNFFCTDL